MVGSVDSRGIFQELAALTSYPQAFPNGFGMVSCGTERAHLYQAFFISPEEREFYEVYGIAALETLFESQAVDPLDIKRPSCIN